MPLSLLNPWVILGIVVALAFAGTSGYIKGNSDANARHEIAIAKRDRLERAKYDALVAERDKQKEMYAKVQAENAKVNNEQISRITGLRIANGRLAAVNGGLFDRNGRPNPGSSVSEAGSTVSSNASGPSGCNISGELQDLLLDEFFRADTAAVYAGTCKVELVELHKFCSER